MRAIIIFVMYYYYFEMNHGEARFLAQENLENWFDSLG